MLTITRQEHGRYWREVRPYWLNPSITPDINKQPWCSHEQRGRVQIGELRMIARVLCEACDIHDGRWFKPDIVEWEPVSMRPVPTREDPLPRRCPLGCT
jgi:hypothetical protein